MKYLSLFSGIGGFEYGINRCFTERDTPDNEGVPSTGSITNCAHELRGSSYPLCVGYSEIDKYGLEHLVIPKCDCEIKS